MKKTTKKQMPKSFLIACGVWESIMSIPFIGWFLTLCYGFGAIISIAGGITGVILSKKKYPFVMMVVAGALGWIPVVGWLLHILAMIFLWNYLYNYK